MEWEAVESLANECSIVNNCYSLPEYRSDADRFASFFRNIHARPGQERKYKVKSDSRHSWRKGDSSCKNKPKLCNRNFRLNLHFEEKILVIRQISGVVEFSLANLFVCYALFLLKGLLYF